MSSIRTFNTAVSKSIKRDETFHALFGQEPFIPETIITSSSDFNCGALCNELEYLRVVSNYYVRSFDISVAEGTNLDSLVRGFIDLPRRTRGEEDEVYRNRFRALAVQQTFPSRTTRWAIINAISHFIDDLSTVQVIENFDTSSTYFEVRIEGATDLDSAIFLDDVDQAYLDQNFVGGGGIGTVITYLGSIIERIKAAGVDFDVVFILQDRFTKSIDVTIGTVQRYKLVSAWVRLITQSTKTVDAEVVV